MKGNWKLILSAFTVVFLSEMGDKTQMTTLLLAGSKPGYVLYVALGAATALITTSLIEVIIGSKVVSRYVKPHYIKVASGVAFTVIGILLLVGILGRGL
ncbi:MAG: TMEM165/GDT1 family protein [Bacillota bacterium]